MTPRAADDGMTVPSFPSQGTGSLLIVHPPREGMDIGDISLIILGVVALVALILAIRSHARALHHLGAAIHDLASAIWESCADEDDGPPDDGEPMSKEQPALKIVGSGK